MWLWFGRVPKGLLTSALAIVVEHLLKRADSNIEITLRRSATLLIMAAQRASGRRGIGDIKVYLARKIGTCTKLVSALKMLLSVFAHFHVSSQKNYECMQPRELARDFVVPIEFVVLVKQIISVGLLWTSAYNIDIDSMGESFSLSLKQFTSGAAATACACVFTNPIEIVKTRLQLNGEMHVPRVYRSPWHAAALMMQEEGASVFVKGLRPAILYQIGSRF